VLSSNSTWFDTSRVVSSQPDATRPDMSCGVEPSGIWSFFCIKSPKVKTADHCEIGMHKLSNIAANIVVPKVKKIYA